MTHDAIATFAKTLRMPDGASASPWTPAIEFKQDEYLRFTTAGGQGYTPDGLFHFFGPTGPVEHALMLWNDPAIWRRHFLKDFNWYAIAEDAFGYQFCIRADGRRPVIKVVSLWSGAFTLVANTFGDFISDIIQNPEAWQYSKERYRLLRKQHEMGFRPFHHLSPPVPPLLDADGKDDTEGYEWTPAATNASILAQVYDQVRNLPPGTKVSDIDIT